MVWFVENGIGEQRALEVKKGRITAARLQWLDELSAGQVDDAKLISRKSGSSRGTVLFPSGEEALVDHLPQDASEGRLLRVEVTRGAIREAKRTKLAHAHPSTKAVRAADLTSDLRAEGYQAEEVYRFPVDGWDDLIADALEAEISFSGGSLQFSPTPAMTLIDIDGNMRGIELALAAIAPVAQAFRLFEVGGSIGIDFPTLETKADRKAVDQALELALSNWPHERTAMSGFGFVHIVSRFARPSLFHRAHGQRLDLVARHLLRQAENLESAGAILLTAHPSVLERISPTFHSDLARRTGREIRLKGSPELAIEAGFAQSVPL
ncbi:ribonuclease [Altererythrobacter indicus]|uniref:Ribonuclease n=1 Tax=Altericroceibacterium indicum TaxID=374177 RepID=A0A845A6R5_9SPHN|nr:ribonuclease E/G [Altericroceibacterium indicum]MXP25059.1 ribonuclease [Altericroceibacterium indicum]